MGLGDEQKSFYDTRRYFQGKDNPDKPLPPGKPAREGIPLGQVIWGLLFLGLIVYGFFSIAFPRPEKAEPAEEGAPAAVSKPAAAPPATPAVPSH